MDPRVIVVAAIADNSVIGRDGGLPWHLKSDLKRFKTLTEGGTVIMGRKTHESIVARLGKPLPNRLNLVLTTDPDYRASGCLVENSLKKALEMLRRFQSIHFANDSWPWTYPRSFLLQAQLHERRGERGEALAAVGVLLGLWKEADPDLPLLADARALRDRVAEPR